MIAGATNRGAPRLFVSTVRTDAIFTLDGRSGDPIFNFRRSGKGIMLYDGRDLLDRELLAL
jgi:hypothetical protein